MKTDWWNLPDNITPEMRELLRRRLEDFEKRFNDEVKPVMEDWLWKGNQENPLLK